jgi:hypothetical protein
MQWRLLLLLLRLPSMARNQSCTQLIARCAHDDDTCVVPHGGDALSRVVS